MITSSACAISARNWQQPVQQTLETIRKLYGNHFFGRQTTGLGTALYDLFETLDAFLNESRSRLNGDPRDAIFAQLVVDINDHVDELTSCLNRSLGNTGSTPEDDQRHTYRLNASTHMISLLASAFDVAAPTRSQQSAHSVDEATSAIERLLVSPTDSHRSDDLQLEKIVASPQSPHRTGGEHVKQDWPCHNTATELPASSPERQDSVEAVGSASTRTVPRVALETNGDIMLSQSELQNALHRCTGGHDAEPHLGEEQVIDCQPRSPAACEMPVDGTLSGSKSIARGERGAEAVSVGASQISTATTRTAGCSLTRDPANLPAPTAGDVCTASVRFSPHHVGSSCDLFVSALEQDITVRRLEDVRTTGNEVEVLNEELPDAMFSRAPGFYDSISASTNTSDAFSPARIRLFRDPDDGSMSLYTERSSQPLQKSVILPSGSELVPRYMFEEKADDAEFYLRYNGDRSSPVYRFRVDSSTHGWYELYGLQGALMGCTFEDEYSAKSTVLCSRYNKEEKERNAKLQFWSRDAEPGMLDTSKDLQRSLSRKRSGASCHQLAPHLNDYLSRIGCSYLLLYARGCIYVIVISSRLCIDRQVQPRTFRWRTHSDLPSQSKTIKVCPDRENGCSAISVRTIKAARGDHAGLPIGEDAITFTDQDGPDFEHYQSLTIEFPLAETCTDFVNNFLRLQQEWKQRCAPFEQYRELQRSRRVKTTTTWCVT